jgi:hypothetical protein
VGQVPDRDLFDLLTRFQAGVQDAGWEFVQHGKIQAIIRGRMRQYRQMFYWLPQEDVEDVEYGLIPRIFELIGNFDLPEQPNDGRILSYFSLRIRGEADYLLKKVTGMRQVIDEEQDKTYLKSVNQSMDGLEDVLEDSRVLSQDVIDGIEHGRQDKLIESVLQALPDWSNDRIWLRCYILKIKNKTWAQIASDIGYRQTDYTWLKDNTSRFITRLKHKLLLMGEEVNYCICALYTDSSSIAISVIDSIDRKRNLVWSKDYSNYNDLDRLEAKLGDIFRQSHISYVVMNEEHSLSPAHAIAMRYLVKREAFVETIDISPFKNMLHRMPKSVAGVQCNDEHIKALLMAHIKKAYLQVTNEGGGK